MDQSHTDKSPSSPERYGFENHAVVRWPEMRFLCVQSWLFLVVAFYFKLVRGAIRDSNSLSNESTA